MSHSRRAIALAILVTIIAPLHCRRAGGVERDPAEGEAEENFVAYLRIDTSNPPGDTRKAADFLASILEREGIPVTRYESAPGKAILYARLKATALPPAGKAVVLLHHMDVVPADRAQWKTDPFAPTRMHSRSEKQPMSSGFLSVLSGCCLHVRPPSAVLKSLFGREKSQPVWCVTK